MRKTAQLLFRNGIDLQMLHRLKVASDMNDRSLNSQIRVILKEWTEKNSAEIDAYTDMYVPAGFTSDYCSICKKRTLHRKTDRECAEVDHSQPSAPEDEDEEIAPE